MSVPRTWSRGTLLAAVLLAGACSGGTSTGGYAPISTHDPPPGGRDNPGSSLDPGASGPESPGNTRDNPGTCLPCNGPFVCTETLEGGTLTAPIFLEQTGAGCVAVAPGDQQMQMGQLVFNCDGSISDPQFQGLISGQWQFLFGGAFSACFTVTVQPPQPGGPAGGNGTGGNPITEPPICITCVPGTVPGFDAGAPSNVDAG